MELPDELKSKIKLEILLDLEKNHNKSFGFLKTWISMLEGGSLNCPERYTKARFDNDDFRRVAMDIWEKHKSILKDEENRRWFINSLKEILKERVLEKKSIQMGVEKSEIESLVVNCACCNDEINLIREYDSNRPYKCAVCGKFYCLRCMRAIHVSVYTLSYKTTKSYELSKVCEQCLETEGIENAIPIFVNTMKSSTF